MLKKILLVSAVVFSVQSHAVKFECETEHAASPYPFFEMTELDNERYAPAFASGKVKRFTSYTAVFDDEDDDNGDGYSDLLANPMFVTYHLPGVTPTDGVYNEPAISIDRPAKWYRSPELIELLGKQTGVTSTLIDDSYRGVGRIWNRGHWAMSDHSQRVSWEASCNTHHFWNASPQAAKLNQGVWAYLETYSAALSNMMGNAWIITGPIFEPGKKIHYIGDDTEIPVAIPHQLFKVIVYEDNGLLRLLPFVFDQNVALKENSKGELMPVSNTKWDTCSSRMKKGREYDLNQYLTSVSYIENKTGLVFFAGLDSTLRQSVAQYKPATIKVIPDNFWSQNSFCNFID